MFGALTRAKARLRLRNPERQPGYDPGEAKIAASSHFIKQLCTRYSVTVMATMEVTKGDLKPGVRPVMAALKGSSAIPYDINANYAVYNDLADMIDDATITWQDNLDQEKTMTATGEEYLVDKTKPILEICVDKNKISGWKGTVFFKMNDVSGNLVECSQEESSRYGALLNGARAPRDVRYTEVLSSHSRE
jgi:hypothetical protein